MKPVEANQSEDFRAFTRSLENRTSRAWIDQLDEGALGRLTGQERRTAEEMLLTAAKTGDWRAPVALANMGAHSAVPVLSDLAFRSSGDLRTYSAMAARILGGGGELLEPIVDELHSSDRHNRISAASALGWFERDKARPFVSEALRDPEYLVRAGAISSVFRLVGRPGAELLDGNRHLFQLIGSNRADEREKAARELEELLAS